MAVWREELQHLQVMADNVEGMLGRKLTMQEVQARPGVRAMRLRQTQLCQQLTSVDHKIRNDMYPVGL